MKDKDQLVSDIFALHIKMNELVFEYKTDQWMKMDLTIDQLKSLIYLDSNRNKMISFKELAQALGITRSNVTGIADRLSRSGLTARSQNPEDRRVQFLVLTDKGKNILENIKQEINVMETRILNALSAEELAVLKKGLSAYVASAESHLLSINNNFAGRKAGAV